MSQQFNVIRGQIESGNTVLAKLGDTYKPRSQEEEKRLLAAGVIAPLISVEEEPLDEEEGDGQGDESGDQQASPEAVAAEPPETPPVKPSTPRRPRK